MSPKINAVRAVLLSVRALARAPVHQARPVSVGVAVYAFLVQANCTDYAYRPTYFPAKGLPSCHLYAVPEGILLDVSPGTFGTAFLQPARSGTVHRRWLR